MKIKIPELKDFKMLKKALPYIKNSLNMVKSFLSFISYSLICLWKWFTNIDGVIITAFFGVSAVILMIGVMFYFTVIEHESGEIEAYEYKRIEEITHKYPDIKPLVVEALEDDGIISNWEDDTIRDAYKDREDAIEEKN